MCFLIEHTSLPEEGECVWYEDPNSIPADKVNRAILVAPPGGQILNWCWWCHLIWIECDNWRYWLNSLGLFCWRQCLFVENSLKTNTTRWHSQKKLIINRKHDICHPLKEKIIFLSICFCPMLSHVLLQLRKHSACIQKAFLQCVWACASWDFELECKNSYTGHIWKAFLLNESAYVLWVH